MNMGIKLKKLTVSGAIAGIALLIFSQSSWGQIVERNYWSQTFLSKEYRSRWTDQYENLGNYDMRRYPRARFLEEGISRDTYVPNIVKRGQVTPVTYDPFGNFLLPGGEIMSMNWNQSKLGASTTTDDRWANNVFNNLMICSDEFSNWQTKFILSKGGYGVGIRSYFTPSTLKITNFGGFRWDLSSRKNNVTLLASTGDRPIYGVHWQSVLGDILKIGATYVGRQRGTVGYSHQDIDGSNTEQLNYMKSEPQYVYVCITDDSPEDTGPGAMVYGIKAYINGKEEQIAFKGEEGRAVMGRMFKIPDLFTQHRFYDNKFGKQYIFNHSNSEFLPDFTDRMRNNRGSWLLYQLDDSTTDGRRKLNDIFHKSGEAGNQGLINIRSKMVDSNASDKDPTVGNGNVEYTRYFKADLDGGPVEAKGSDVVIFELLVPKGTRSLSFNVNVANDYCIDIIAPLYSNRQNREAGWYDKTLSEQWNGSWSITSYDSKHCVKAKGNVKDGSNQRWEKVTYDRLTGMNVYGMDVEFNWRGFYLRGEFNENNTFRSYPLNHKLSGADENKYKSRAWFVNAEKTFGKMSLGTELFNYPNEYMQYWAPIDDNDDDDWKPQVSAFDGSVNSSTYDNYVQYNDIDFDRYQDRYFFYDSSTGDEVPFLSYYYDTVTVGDDFNHNGTIDGRENDSNIDLPYERDSRGQHYFFKIQPRESTVFTLGHYDVRQEYQDGRNFTRYMKFEHFQRVKGLGEFLFYQRTERIKDDYNLDWNEGNHNLINNWKFTNVMSTRLTFIPGVNIINNANFISSYNVGNLRRTDGTEEEVIRNLLEIYDGTEMISRFGGYSYALEHKIDYTFKVADARLIPQINLGGFRLVKEKKIKELKFMPMIKVVHSYSFANQNNLDIKETDRKNKSLSVFPIVRFDYRVAPKTLLRFGIQGFPGFPEMYRARTRYEGKLYDYDQRVMVCALENQTLYEGFNLLVMMGVRFSKKKYIHDISKKDPGYTEYFITLQSEAR